MRSWNDFLLLKEKELGRATIEKWLLSLKVLNYDAGNLYLEASDSFQAQWFDEYIRPSLKNDFCSESGRPIKVHVQVRNKALMPRPVKTEPEPHRYEPDLDPIDPQNTFDELIHFEQNKILFKLFGEFKNYSAPIYNPIYIYGMAGMGKTHLLQAAYHLLKDQNLNVLYVRLPTFMENMVKAIKASKMPEFRRFYRDVDVLIVDDIHQLSHKNATQEEFFHTFNALHIEGKQILLSANCNPQQLKAIEPRLMSRFEWGIVLPLNRPRDNELKEILDAKIKQLNFPLDDHAKDFLVKRFSKSPQVLQRALSALVLRAHLKLPQGKKLKSSYLSAQSMELLLSDLIQEQEQATVSSDRILDKVANYFGIKRADILGKSQSRDCALPRQISMYFCRELLKMPFMQIGRLFSRDHSTVMSSVKQVQKGLKDPENNLSSTMVALQELIVPQKTVSIS